LLALFLSSFLCYEYLSLVPSLTAGDHKPVSALFDVTLEIIVPERFNEIHSMVLRELDRLENEARPVLELSDDQVHFGKIAYLEPRTRSVTIKNKGAVSPLVPILTFS